MHSFKTIVRFFIMQGSIYLGGMEEDHLQSPHLQRPHFQQQHLQPLLLHPQKLCLQVREWHRSQLHNPHQQQYLQVSIVLHLWEKSIVATKKFIKS